MEGGVGEMLLQSEFGGGVTSTAWEQRRDCGWLLTESTADPELGQVGTTGKGSAVCWRKDMRKTRHFRGRALEYSTEYSCRPKSPVASTWSPLTGDSKIVGNFQ